MLPHESGHIEHEVDVVAVRWDAIEGRLAGVLALAQQARDLASLDLIEGGTWKLAPSACHQAFQQPRLNRIAVHLTQERGEA